MHEITCPPLSEDSKPFPLQGPPGPEAGYARSRQPDLPASLRRDPEYTSSPVKDHILFRKDSLKDAIQYQILGRALVK